MSEVKADVGGLMEANEDEIHRLRVALQASREETSAVLESHRKLSQELQPMITFTADAQRTVKEIFRAEIDVLRSANRRSTAELTRRLEASETLVQALSEKLKASHEETRAAKAESRDARDTLRVSMQETSDSIQMASDLTRRLEAAETLVIEHCDAAKKLSEKLMASRQETRFLEERLTSCRCQLLPVSQGATAVVTTIAGSTKPPTKESVTGDNPTRRFTASVRIIDIPRSVKLSKIRAVASKYGDLEDALWHGPDSSDCLVVFTKSTSARDFVNAENCQIGAAKLVRVFYFD
jgi:hypothetical protein